MSKSKIVLNSGIYSFINLLQKGINFLLVPVLTVYLTTFDYGIVAVVTAVNAFLNVFYLLSLNGSLNRFYYEYREDNDKLKELFGTIVTFVFLFSFTLSIILLLGHSIFIDPFLDNIAFYPYMFLGMISVFFNPIFTIYQNTLQAKQEGKRFGRNSVAFFITNVTFLLISVVIFDMGAYGVLGSLALTNIIFFFFTLFHFGKELQLGINRRILKESLRYSLPLVPHSISGVATNIIDRLFVNNMLSTSATGIYNLGSTFGGIIFLFASGINQAFVPWFNEQVKASRLKEIPRYANLVIYLYSLIALGISYFGKELIALITPLAYHEAWRVIPFIAFAFVFHGIYYFFSMPLFYDISGKGSRTLPVYTISAALLNIVLNFLLIREFGMIGAAAATLIAKIFLVMALSKVYRRFLKIEYQNAFLILIPILFFLFSLVVYVELPFINGMLLKTFIYLVIIAISTLVFKNDLSKLYAFLVKIKSR